MQVTRKGRMKQNIHSEASAQFWWRGTVTLSSGSDP